MLCVWCWEMHLPVGWINWWVSTQWIWPVWMTCCGVVVLCLSQGLILCNKKRINSSMIAYRDKILTRSLWGVAQSLTKSRQNFMFLGEITFGHTWAPFFNHMKPELMQCYLSKSYPAIIHFYFTFTVDTLDWLFVLFQD